MKSSAAQAEQTEKSANKSLILMQIILMKWNCALQRPCFYAHGNFNRVFYTFCTKWLLWNSSSPSSRILQSSTDSPLRSTAR